uniref:CUB domain-containing protein n=1 Tax=Macrostomum lignano TaxID=282301 RepID=A0A1I8FAX1_9PLAT
PPKTSGSQHKCSLHVRDSGGKQAYIGFTIRLFRLILGLRYNRLIDPADYFAHALAHDIRICVSRLEIVALVFSPQSPLQFNATTSRVYGLAWRKQQLTALPTPVYLLATSNMVLVFGCIINYGINYCPRLSIIEEAKKMFRYCKDSKADGQPWPDFAAALAPHLTPIQLIDMPLGTCTSSKYEFPMRYYLASAGACPDTGQNRVTTPDPMLPPQPVWPPTFAPSSSRSGLRRPIKRLGCVNDSYGNNLRVLPLQLCTHASDDGEGIPFDADVGPKQFVVLVRSTVSPNAPPPCRPRCPEIKSTCACRLTICQHQLKVPGSVVNFTVDWTVVGYDSDGAVIDGFVESTAYSGPVDQLVILRRVASEKLAGMLISNAIGMHTLEFLLEGNCSSYNYGESIPTIRRARAQRVSRHALTCRANPRLSRCGSRKAETTWCTTSGDYYIPAWATYRRRYIDQPPSLLSRGRGRMLDIRIIAYGVWRSGSQRECCGLGKRSAIDGHPNKAVMVQTPSSKKLEAPGNPRAEKGPYMYLYDKQAHAAARRDRAMVSLEKLMLQQKLLKSLPSYAST